VAEKTPHRHHTLGGIHGLSEYVSSTTSKWQNIRSENGLYHLPIATKATILGHTLRGAPAAPEDKALGQFLAYEAVQRLVENPHSVVGCCLGSYGLGHIEPIPLHAVRPKQFDWQLFTRMHGIEYISTET
jgi:6-phosphofructokinase 1